MRIVLIGCGLWGRNLLRDLVLLGAQVEVHDPDPSARAVAFELGAIATNDGTRSIRGDGVVIATPARMHEESLNRALDAGAPLLIEKPLSISVASAERMASAVAAAGVRAHMVDVWRDHGAVRQLAALIAGGDLGLVRGAVAQRMNWTSPRTDVDTLDNLGPHEISLYRALFAAEPTAEAAHAEYGTQAQIVSAWIRLGRQPWLQSELSNRSPTRVRTLRVHGSDAVAVFDQRTPLELLIARGGADTALEAAERRTLEIDPEPALRRQLRLWLDALRGGPSPQTTLADGVASVRLVTALRALAA